MQLGRSSHVWCRTLFFAAVVAAPSTLRAAEPPRPAREYRVDFAADRVQVDGELGWLELDGRVHVQAQRYRLKSEHLQLRRGPRGVEAEGTADVAFCTCDDPPLRLRVSHATLAPPTDALFSNVRLEVGGVPVFWSPALWLRAPTRFGLTLPRVAYRGQDGFFAGAGFYLPIAAEDGRVTRSLSVNAGAYELHGVRLEGDFDTEASSTRVWWDRVRQSALGVDAHGSAALSEATVAFRVDALHGPRGRVESSSLEVAARPMDRARLSLSRVDELALGFGLRADAPRGAAFRDFGAAGPELYLGAARNLGSSVSYDVFGVARSTTSSGNHSQSALFERGLLRASLRPGPVGIELSAAQSAELQTGEYDSRALLRTGVSVRAGLPLLRRFGSVAHLVEPLVIGRGWIESQPRGSALDERHSVLSAFGVDTSAGQHVTRQGLALSARSGLLDESGTTSFVGGTRTSIDLRVIGAAQSFVLQGRRSLSSLSRVRLGSSDGLHLSLRADGASNGAPRAPRILFEESWFDAPRPFLSRDGWSAGSEVSVPWTRALSTNASVDYDFSQRELLAVWGGVGYRHPCGCLAVASFAGHRVGRGGFDAWLGFDLAP